MPGGARPMRDSGPSPPSEPARASQLPARDPCRRSSHRRETPRGVRRRRAPLRRDPFSASLRDSHHTRSATERDARRASAGRRADPDTTTESFGAHNVSLSDARRMGETSAYVQSFAGFPRVLRAYLREALTLPRARAMVAERFAEREQNFLRIVDRSIDRHPSSPYLALLRRAGCERGDLETLVVREGLEGALHALHAAGVYVTFENSRAARPSSAGRRRLPSLLATSTIRAHGAT